MKSGEPERETRNPNLDVLPRSAYEADLDRYLTSVRHIDGCAAGEHQRVNLVDAVFAVADAIREAGRCIGTDSVPFGGLELVAKEIKDGTNRVADALNQIGENK